MAVLVGSGRTAFLLSASSTEVHAAYWALENHVVAQGTVYSAAEPVVTVLIAAFTDPRIRQFKIAALQIMYQVLTGLADASSSDRTNERIDRSVSGTAFEKGSGYWFTRRSRARESHRWM